MTCPAPNTALRAIAAAALVTTALPAAAQGQDALLQEIKALRERVEQLERQLAAARQTQRDAKPPTVQLRKLYDKRSPLLAKVRKQADYGKELEEPASSYRDCWN